MENNDNKTISKYNNKIQKDNKNYLIEIYVDKGKMHISCKYMKNCEYTTFYSFKQLQIINKYFTQFKSIEEIAFDLHRILDTKKVSFEEKNNYLLLSIKYKTGNKSNNIILKLMQNKIISDINSINSKISNINAIKNNNSISMPKYGDNNEKEKECDISDIISYPLFVPLAKVSKPIDKETNNCLNNVNKKKQEEDYNEEDIKPESIHDSVKKSKRKKNNNEQRSHKYDTNYNESDKKKNYNNNYRSINNIPSHKKDEEEFYNKKKAKRTVSSIKESNREKETQSRNVQSIQNENNSKDYNQKEFAELTGLQMPDREDLKNYVNSRIFFTKKELQLVKKKITKGDKNMHALFDVLYRASIDGDYEEAINCYSEGIYPQLILFYTTQGARFGVYIDKKKHTSFFGNVSYKEIPGTSFLVSLNSLKIFDVLKKGKATDNRDEKLCFGRSFYFNDNGSNWFIYTPRNYFLNAPCMLGEKECSFGKIDFKEIVGNNKDYKLKEVEIFKVSVEYFEKFDDDDNIDNMNDLGSNEVKDRRYKGHKKLKRYKSDNTKFKKRKKEDNRYY